MLVAAVSLLIDTLCCLVGRRIFTCFRPSEEMAANAFRNALSGSRISNIATKFQGGRLSKIGDYFKNIFNDYQTVAVETLGDMKSHPIKATIYITSLGITGYLIKTNPSKELFYQSITENANKLVTVGDPIRNPYSDTHIRNLVDCANRGVLRRLTFGVCSFMWVENFDASVDLYEAQCKHLKVGWLDWRERIVDFGILGRWWQLDKAMQEYDINPDEWKAAV